VDERAGARRVGARGERPAAPLQTCNGAYCLQGPNMTLTRNWELGRFASAGRNSPPDPLKPHVGVGLHAWEGGFGYPDCLCASRAMPAFGTTFRARACYSLSDGWVT
jgi:hypothetical protein